MKLAFALAARSMVEGEMYDAFKKMELETTHCYSKHCDLNTDGKCTVGYCRRAEKFVSTGQIA